MFTYVFNSLLIALRIPSGRFKWALLAQTCVTSFSGVVLVNFTWMQVYLSAGIGIYFGGSCAHGTMVMNIRGLTQTNVRAELAALLWVAEHLSTPK